jgi:hypothetical protein
MLNRFSQLNQKINLVTQAKRQSVNYMRKPLKHSNVCRPFRCRRVFSIRTASLSYKLRIRLALSGLKEEDGLFENERCPHLERPNSSGSFFSFFFKYFSLCRFSR